MEIIPAIIGKDITEIARKIALVEPYVKWAQIDVSDGIFTPNTTWNSSEELHSIITEVSLELHLMIEDPAKHLDYWVISGAKRIIVHVNSASTHEEVAAMAKKAKSGGVAFGIALSPEVSVEDVKSLVPLADVVLLLAVSPGFSGQKFNESILRKARDLRKAFPNVIIEVDGGINPVTAKTCVEAGADILVSGSYIFESADIKEAIENLK